MSDRLITPFDVIASESSRDKPSREAAEAAVKTLIRWIGDDPEREGLRETPSRVIKAFDELYGGYDADIKTLMTRTFSETDNYDEFVLVRDIGFVSHCEHHMLPFKGVAHIAYFPKDKVVGLSKLARLTEAFGRRLQTQEKLTSQIFNAIEAFLDPRGIAISIEAEHSCMSMRGVKSHGASTFTSRFSGLFSTPLHKDRFYRLIETK